MNKNFFFFNNKRLLSLFNSDAELFVHMKDHIWKLMLWGFLNNFNKVRKIAKSGDLHELMVFVTLRQFSCASWSLSLQLSCSDHIITNNTFQEKCHNKASVTQTVFSGIFWRRACTGGNMWALLHSTFKDLLSLLVSCYIFSHWCPISTDFLLTYT